VSEGEERTWTGRRDANTGLAWTVIALGAGLVAIALFQVVYWDASVNPWFLAMVVAGMIAYGAISFTSYAEMVVTLGEGELTYTKREWSVGRVITEATARVERDRMSKVVERNAGLGVRAVRFEDVDGRRLLTFPEFLPSKEHDAMMEAIVDWGAQPSPSSAGTDETPRPESR
jgi:hypothetical protein